MAEKRLAGQRLKQAILMCDGLPDHPKVFRPQGALLALENEGYTVNPSTLRNELRKLSEQGYLQRKPDKRGEEVLRHNYWYGFERPDRASIRPGFRPGEPQDVMLWKPLAKEAK